MKYPLSLLFVFVFSIFTCFAHDSHYERANERTWTLSGGAEKINGTFLAWQDNVVLIEESSGAIIRVPQEKLSPEDYAVAQQYIKRISALNHTVKNTGQTEHPTDHHHNKTAYWLLLLTIVSVLFIVAAKFISSKRGWALLLLCAGGLLAGFTPQLKHALLTITDPLFVDSAFTPFKPEVNTRWDSTYFYVESKGIPNTHSMMTGITKWQQQVTIPQCYIDTNAWSIPLNPVIAANPVPVSPSHFIRGAIALAVNGVPIFNPYTNTGVDAFLDGQLDNWGGHSGRADDYHYHTAPLHLYNHVNVTQPIAFGLDGFAVYGDFEPDGSSMQPLDTNHGHFGGNGVYHYHGTPVAPYMIGNMVGVVTEDSTLQIIPQSRARPVRPSLTPLTGATITGFHPNISTNGYTLIYTLNGQTDSIVYYWTQNGQYTYDFYLQGNGIPTTQQYNGFAPCSVPTSVTDYSTYNNRVTIYPTPARDVINIDYQAGVLSDKQTQLRVMDVHGKIIYEKHGAVNSIPVSSWPAGVYYIDILIGGKHSVQKAVVNHF